MSVSLLGPISTRTSRTVVKPARHSYHDAILVAECVAFLAPQPGRLYVDVTLGGGGHAAALLAKGADVIGIDQDPAALDFASDRLSEWSTHFRAIRGNFANAGELLDNLGVHQIDGALLDLGVSSHQLDRPERGFSFQADGPLDMRMDPSSPLTAADLVNTMSGEQLERIFREYGEESAARKIVARLTRERQVRPLKTTRELAELVSSVVSRHGRAHPATRVFQALRIAVNRELEMLEPGLIQLSRRLAPGARFAVITFHSLEDRIVKSFFKQRTTEWLDRPEWPERRRNPDCHFRALTRKAVTASAAEQRLNPRSRSARLRVVEQL